MLKSKLVAAAALVSFAAPVGVVVTATTADATTLYYSSCTKLAARWSHGVAKSYSAAQYQVRQGYGRPAYSDLAKKVYWKNKSRLDRDNDGTACER
jgi:hypothetical protein